MLINSQHHSKLSNMYRFVRQALPLVKPGASTGLTRSIQKRFFSTPTTPTTPTTPIVPVLPVNKMTPRQEFFHNYKNSMEFRGIVNGTLCGSVAAVTASVWLGSQEYVVTPIEVTAVSAACGVAAFVAGSLFELAAPILLAGGVLITSGYQTGKFIKNKKFFTSSEK